MRLHKKLAVLTLAPHVTLLFVVFLQSSELIAGPDPPTVSGTLAVFTGDQSDGVVSGVGFTCPPIHAVDVNSLTEDIKPADGTAGIQISCVLPKGRNGSGAYIWNGDSGSPGGSDAIGVAVDFQGDGYQIVTSGNDGVLASSLGGRGGKGQNVVGWLGVAFGGNGGAGGYSGPVSVASNGHIRTDGDLANGILAESQGGKGGNGGWAGTLAYGDGGDGGVGGSGGAVSVESSSQIMTLGSSSRGIFGRSVGGAGGTGGTGGATVGRGGGSLGSGPAGAVQVTSHGDIQTFGTDADGLFAQSLGGGGGAAGTGIGGVAWGSTGNSVGAGNAVTVTNTGDVSTRGVGSHSILAQSVGGGGGKGSSSAGLFAFGAEGAAGGDGGPVTVANSGNLETTRMDASAVFAQSLGGGGGNGGGSSAIAGLALGGRGGPGSVSNHVEVTSDEVTIATAGDRSHGIFAQSLGGGGGNGGQAVALSLSSEVSVGVSVGGAGGGGGDGSTVDVQSTSTVITRGLDAHGIFAQSTGGGGGNGGFSMSGSGSGGIALAVAYGGAGGGGGHGKTVSVTGSPAVQTWGPRSVGLFAQSVGGGGGSGGFSIAAAAAGGFGGSVSLGGSGGGGGDGGHVQLGSDGEVLDLTITTRGFKAHGIQAQSVGGGGGRGGFGLSAAGGGLGAVAFSLGGSGGEGGSSQSVQVNSAGTINSFGDEAVGLFAQSVGGGGGDGGFSIAGAGAGKGAASISLGGAAGGGGDSETVTVHSEHNITTRGYQAHGLQAQSVGGGGGSGGFSLSGSGAGTGSGAISIGGAGGDGGNSKRVTVTGSGRIDTSGQKAFGLFAQSVGGGGGSGGFSISGTGAGTGSATLNLGGSGGGGGNADEVLVAIDVGENLHIATRGDDAHGLVAQSIGGGGGNGGFSITGSGAGTGSGSIGIGGSGGNGGTSQQVTVSGSVTIETRGASATGLFAQSVGGGGGNGRFSISGSAAGTGSGSLSLGGSAGGGGDGSVVQLGDSSSRLESKITTHGDESHGMFAQSVGGGGGKGGFSVTGSGAGTGSASLGIGGSGGDGGDGKGVALYSSGRIDTFGHQATGLLAQSVGGGGGAGGFSVSGSGAKTISAAFSLGGDGGLGGAGDAVTVDSLADIATRGQLSYGLLAQSVGGGGGAGGFSFSGSVTTTRGNLNAALGGSGGVGGDGGVVDLRSGGQVTTASDGAHGILAQSLGGGGGAGGFSGSIAAGTGNKPNVALSIGGAGGIAGHGNSVSLQNDGAVHTQGVAAYGLFAQSVGGGGGDGGGSFSVALGRRTSGGLGAWNGSISVGGGGGAAGNAGEVNLINHGNVLTEGIKSHGLVAQGVGGGGGTGGFAATGAFTVGTEAKDVAVSVGGQGGAGGDGSPVHVRNSGNVTTRATVTRNVPSDAVEAEEARDMLGNGAMGILAQSIGGGGGNGGFSFAGSFSGPQAKNLSVSVGGAGGSGGKGMLVDVTNDGVIGTSGANSQAILAQSIGGGGGNGGASVAVDFGISTTTGANQNVAVAVGGSGGNGNTADAVDVTNRGELATQGVSSDGIVAQSIGGGGGNGGYSLSLTTSLEKADAELGHAKQPLDIAIAIGGGGGDGNHGGTVDVTNEGPVSTFDNSSRGIFAQSVGGGGGKGGDARAIAVDFDPSEWTLPGQSLPEWREKFSEKLKVLTKDVLLTLSVAVGGAGGGASDGGGVTVANRNDVTTRGSQSYGVYAQSVGGGGGWGGSASQGIDFNWFEVPEEFHPHLEAVLEATPLRALEDVQFVLGGSAGSSGHGDVVRVENEGTITTLGEAATALFAQSIGGGGGVGGQGAGGVTGKVSIGGAGGATGDGGEVVVVHRGLLDTSGVGAYGIAAESVGGGGGVAGDLGLGIFDFGVGLAIGRDGGGGGSGGAVIVDSSGDITTRGMGAVGIFAHSVGGGGGIVGDVGRGFGFAGSVGADGSGGAVTVTHIGNITTLGAGSHGIFAQSAGGKQTGGDVNVTLQGAISTLGVNASGIIAQSRGDLGAAPILVNISQDASVIGGSWDGIDVQMVGVGVRIIDGADNVLTNAGTIAALGGTAILAGTGNDTVHNSGTIAGVVDLGEGLNAFDNQPGGVFETGETVQLGAGNALTNAGVLSPGGSDTALHTTMSGDLVQPEGLPGVLKMEIGGFESGLFDVLDIQGTAVLTGGAINLSFLPDYDITADIAPGERLTLEFLEADSLASFSSTVSFEFEGSPPGFDYGVFLEDNGLFFEAIHTAATIPEPFAVTLLVLGMSIVVSSRLHCKRRKTSASMG